MSTRSDHSLDRLGQAARRLILLLIAAALAARLGGLAAESVLAQDLGATTLRLCVPFTGAVWIGGLLFFPRDWLMSRGRIGPPDPVRLGWGSLLLLALAALMGSSWCRRTVLTRAIETDQAELVAALAAHSRSGEPLPRNRATLESALGMQIDTHVRRDLGPLTFRWPHNAPWRLECRLLTSEPPFGSSLLLVGKSDPQAPGPGPWRLWVHD